MGELAFFAHFSLRLAKAKAGRRRREGCARTDAALAASTTMDIHMQFVPESQKRVVDRVKRSQHNML
jgi:hypothetical protein